MKRKTITFLTLAMAVLIALSSVSAANIHRMVEKKQYKNLRNLMFDKSVNPDMVDAQGKTPLQLAIELGYSDIVEFLLTIKADPNRQDNKKETPLFYAVRKGNLDIVKILEKNDAQVDISNKDGNTALQIALENNKNEIAQYLIGMGADIFHQNANGQTPAEFAMLKNTASFELIATPENIEKIKDDTTLLSLATKNGLVPIVETLIYKGSPLEFGKIDGKNLIDYALEKSNDPNFAQIAILFAQKGIKISNPEFSYVDYYVNAPRTAGFYSQGGFPLHKAAAAGHIGFVKYFRNRQFDINKKDDQALTPLHIAILNGHKEVATYLINEKVNLNERTPLGDTALTLILKDNLEKQDDMAQLLVRAGADVNIQNNWGSSPLLLAIQNEFSAETIDLLFRTDNSTAIARNNDGITPLHAAVIVGNKDIILKILSVDTNINAVDNAGNTPFFLAVDKGTEFLSWFIDNVNLFTKDEEGNSLLHLAILKNSDPELIKLLLVKGIPLNQKNINGDTPLLMSVRNNNTEISRLLLEAGADLFIDNKKKETPMSLALTQPWDPDNNWFSNSKFLEAKDYAGNSPLHWAINYNRMDVAKQILTLGIKIDQVNNSGRTPLHLAILKENADIIKLLLKEGADPNARDFVGNTVYHYMVTNDSIELMELFDNYEIDINTANIYGKTALHEAIEKKNTAITKKLLEKGASVLVKDNMGRTPVHVAASSGNLAVLQLLKNARAPFNLRDSQGQTPLHYAIANGQRVVTTYLVCNGADIYATNSNGETPLSLVFKDKEVTDWFIDSESVNIPDNQGRSPLHIAVIEKASPEIIQILIAKGANLNLKDMAGKTPLTYAMENSNKEAATLLVNNNADIFAIDRTGNCPFNLARKEGTATLDWFITKDNLNFTDNQGNTPLHHVAIAHDDELYTYLLKRGANAEIFNKDGYSAASLVKIAPIQ